MTLIHINHLSAEEQRYPLSIINYQLKLPSIINYQLIEFRMKDGKQTSDSWETAGPKRSGVLYSLTPFSLGGMPKK